MLLNIPVTEEGQIVGLINRDTFMRSMARRFHWEIYSTKRCTKMMDATPFVVEVDTPIRELANGLLDINHPTYLSDGFVIVEQGRLFGTGLTSDVLAAILILEREASDALRVHGELLAELVKQRTYDLEVAIANEQKQKAENALAKEVIERMSVRDGHDEDYLQYWIEPAENFSGDTVATARSQKGVDYVLLADASGHGLTAAITVVPLLTLFYRLAEQSWPLEQIANELNRELKETMPVGRFVAAILMTIERDSGRIRIWHGGMPEILHLDVRGNVLTRYSSEHPPLGIFDFDERSTTVRNLDIAHGEQIILFSDGLLEAMSPAGEEFGIDRIEKALRHHSGKDQVARLRKALDHHTEKVPPHDDVSLVVIHFPVTRH